MIDVGIKIDPRDAVSGLRRLQSRVQFATAFALTKTAQAAQGALKAEMLRVFDKPVRYTLNSIAIKPATKSNLVARVFLKDEGSGTPAGKYLIPQIYGARRRSKRFERALFNAPGLRARAAEFGYASPQLMTAVGTGVANANGNITGARIVRVLSSLRAFNETGFAANETGNSRQKNKRRSSYFVGYPRRSGDPKNSSRSPAGRPLGIWERVGRNKLRPVLIFIKPPTYTRRLDYFGVIQRTRAQVFDAFLKQGLARP